MSAEYELASSKNESNSRYTILVVEDNDLNLKLFRDILQSQNFSVVETKDGFEAFPLVKSRKFDLIIMDIQLRGISGFEIIKQIKADPESRHIPIIAVTAFAMKDDKEKILSSGCEVYLPKPISIGLFIDTVNKYLKLS